MPAHAGDGADIMVQVGRPTYGATWYCVGGRWIACRRRRVRSPGRWWPVSDRPTLRAERRGVFAALAGVAQRPSSSRASIAVSAAFGVSWPAASMEDLVTAIPLARRRNHRIDHVRHSLLDRVDALPNRGGSVNFFADTLIDGWALARLWNIRPPTREQSSIKWVPTVRFCQPVSVPNSQQVGATLTLRPGPVENPCARELRRLQSPAVVADTRGGCSSACAVCAACRHASTASCNELV